MHTRCKHKLTSIVAEECMKHAGGGKQQGGNKLHCVRWCHNEVTHTYGGRNCTVLSLTLSFCPFILLSNRTRGREVKQVVKISNSFQAQIKWNTKYYEGKCCGETEQFELFIYICNLCCCNPRSVICHIGSESGPNMKRYPCILELLWLRRYSRSSVNQKNGGSIPAPVCMLKYSWARIPNPELLLVCSPHMLDRKWWYNGQFVLL